MCCRHGLHISLRHVLLVAVCCRGAAVPERETPRSGWPVLFLFRCRGLPSRPFQVQRRASQPDAGTGSGFQEALALSEAGRWQAAAAAWRGVLEDPSSLPEGIRPYAHCALGDALQKLGRDRQAAEEFTAATSLAPNFAAAALRRGTALRRLEAPKPPTGACFTARMERGKRQRKSSRRPVQELRPRCCGRACHRHSAELVDCKL